MAAACCVDHSTWPRVRKVLVCWAVGDAGDVGNVGDTGDDGAVGNVSDAGDVDDAGDMPSIKGAHYSKRTIIFCKDAPNPSWLVVFLFYLEMCRQANRCTIAP